MRKKRLLEKLAIEERSRSGNEGVSYFRLPAVKPDVLIPVIKVGLK